MADTITVRKKSLSDKVLLAMEISRDTQTAFIGKACEFYCNNALNEESHDAKANVISEPVVSPSSIDIVDAIKPMLERLNANIENAKKHNVEIDVSSINQIMPLLVNIQEGIDKNNNLILSLQKQMALLSNNGDSVNVVPEVKVSETTSKYDGIVGKSISGMSIRNY